MKRILIQDDDESLFNVPLEPILYLYYTENSKEIRRMLKQQYVGFWIQFVTSFRSYISNHDFTVIGSPESYEEAFIDMLKMLTRENSFLEFTTLIESLKRLHMLLNSLCGYFMMEANILRAQAMSGFSKPLHTFPVYSRFVGSIVVLYQRWRHAPRVRGRTPPAIWTPPAHWSQQNSYETSAYESYLHECWGNKLYKMIHVDKDLIQFFKLKAGDESSKSQNEVDNTRSRRSRRNRKRNRRNRRRMGGSTRQNGTQNEAVFLNERKETDATCSKPCAKEYISNVEQSITETKDNVQTESRTGQKQKKETTPSAATSDVETDRTGTFRYDKLFNNSRRKVNDESVGSNMKENDGKKSSMSPPVSKEVRKDDTFRHDKLFKFSTKRHKSRNSESDMDTQDVQGANTTKNKQEDEVPLPADKDSASNSNASYRTAENCSFMYHRLFNFSKNKHTVQNRVPTKNDEMGANSNVGNTFKGTVPHSTNKEFATNEDQKSKTGGSDFFKYDRLFNFGEKKDMVPNGVSNKKDDKGANTNAGNPKKTEAVSHPTDKECTTDRSKKSRSEENDSFKYDRLFNFSTSNQNVPDNTEEVYISSSSDDSLTDYDSETAFEASDDDDHIGFNYFSRAPFRGPSQPAYRKKKVQPVRKFLMYKCKNCNILEKYPGMYKVCKMCVGERVKTPNIYCGPHCGRIHWRKEHRYDHRC